MRTAAAAARSPIEPPNPLAARAPEPTAGGRPESRRTTGAPAGAASRGRRARRLSFGPSEHRDRWRPEDRATGSPMGNTARGAARQPIETDDPTRSRSGTKRPPADRRNAASPASRAARAGAVVSRGRRSRRLSFGPAEQGDRMATGRPNAGSPKGSTAPGATRQPIETDDPARSRSGTKRPPADRSHPVSPAHGRPGPARSRAVVGLADSPSGLRNTATERRSEDRTPVVRKDHGAGNRPSSGRTRRPHRALAQRKGPSAADRTYPASPASRPARAGAVSRGRRSRRLVLRSCGTPRPNGGPVRRQPGGGREDSARPRHPKPAAPPARAPERTAARPGGVTPHCRRPGRPAPAQRGLVARLADSPSVVRNTATEWRPENRTAKVRR